ncbi:hypothetical protein ACFSQ3_13040 [Sphingobacterium corticis]|uniref:Uncharacterized protein n=1 Tax=Sphingobacterium corticis TaxID=1812823 RepID=A0ABW5NMA5_9SPHI
MEQQKSDIVKRDHQLGLVHKLSNEVQAMTSERICDLSRLRVDQVLLGSVHKAFRDRGQEVADDEAEYITNNLYDSVLSACPYVRIAEIPIAIEKGILGDLGEFFGLNVVTFTNFIKRHYASEKRAKNASQLPKSEEQKPAPTESEVLDRDKSLLISAFDMYKSVGYYEDHGNYMYRVAAKKLKLFDLSPERKKSFLDQGKVRAIEKLKNEQVQKPFDRHRINQEIIDAQNLTKDSDGLRRVYKESLQLALMDYFKGLMEMGEEIENLISIDDSD